MIEVYTDGACSGNPGPGGWGAVVLEDGIVINAASERSPQTTNNKEEMKAILWALQTYGKERPLPIVWSDSAYSVNTFNSWMWNWKNNGWLKSDGREPENLDLITRYDELTKRDYRIDLRKVAGHSGVKYNEVADGLATGKIRIEEAMNIG